jgi:hypothetical protein
MKIHPLLAELLQPDRRTDRHDKTNSIFICNFAKARKNIAAIKAGCKLWFATVPLVTLETLKSEEPMAMSTLPAIRGFLSSLKKETIGAFETLEANCRYTYCHISKFSNIYNLLDLYNFFHI